MPRCVISLKEQILEGVAMKPGCKGPPHGACRALQGGQVMVGGAEGLGEFVRGGASSG